MFNVCRAVYLFVHCAHFIALSNPFHYTIISLGITIYKNNPVTFTLDSLLLLSESFSINLPPLQDELIELQAEHNELLNNDYVRLWLSLQKPTIKLLATRILSLFSSTYVCKASFSALNNIKSKRRSRLTDDHLRSALICAVSNLEPDYELLSTEQHCHRSHWLECYWFCFNNNELTNTIKNLLEYTNF